MKNTDQPKPGILKRRWKSIAGGVLALLLLVVALAPSLIVQTGWLKSLVNQNSGLKGEIDFQSASLGWFSHVQLNDLTLIQDEKKVISAELITVKRSLFDLIFSGIDGAEIALSKAELNVVHEGGVLNLADLTLDDDDSETSSLPQLVIQIDDSKIHFLELDTLQGTLEEVQSVVQLGSRDDQQVIQVSVGSRVMVGGKTGSLETEVTLNFDQQFGLESADIMAKADQAGMQIANPIFRWLEIPEFSALLDGQATVSLRHNELGWVVDSEFEELNLASADPQNHSILKTGVVIPVRLDGKLFWNPEESSPPTQLKLFCDYGALDIQGQIPQADALNFDQLFEQDMRLEGKFDLAKFASDFPQWLPTHNGLKLDHGEIAFNAFCRDEGNQRRILVDARADRITAESGQGSLVWDKPVEVSLALGKNRASSQTRIEFFDVKSEFLTGSGSGDLNNGTVNLTGDLGRLYMRLSQFFQMGDFELGGVVKGGVEWQTTAITQEKMQATDRLRLFGKMNVNDFVFGFDPKNRWDEHAMAISFDVVSDFRDHICVAIEKFEALLAIDDDSIQVIQRKPVELVENYQIIYDAELKGASEKWMQRVNSLFDLGLSLKGNAKVNTVVSTTPTTFRVRTRQFLATPFELSVGEMVVSEPGVQANLDVVYNKVNGNLTVNKCLLESPNVRVETPTEFTLDTTALQSFEQTKLTVSANANQLSKWFLPEGLLAQGLISGDILINSADHRLRVSGNLQSYDFELLQVTQSDQTRKIEVSELIKKGKSEWSCSLGFNESFDEIAFHKLSWRNLGNALELKGRLVLKDQVVADLNGTFESDMKELCDQLKPLIGEQIKIVGKSKNAVALKGPLTSQDADDLKALLPRKLNGSAEIKWESGDLFSLPLSKGSLQGVLQNSQVAVQPNNVRVGNAQLVATPTIQLNSDAYMLSVPKGWVVQNANIQPEVFRNWMRYVTPLLADATHAQGKFSVALDENLHMPLSNPLSSKLVGRLHVDSVTVGPGELGQSLISMTRQVLALFGKGEKLGSLATKPWLELPKQEIRVSVDGGKVTHQQLRIQMGEVAIYTTGSVDVNQNLNMLIQIPVAEDWFSERPILKSVVGDVIQIPLQGNVSNPKFNVDLLSRITKQMTSGALDKLLQKGAKELLDGKLLDGKLLEGNDKKDLGKFFEGKAKDLLREKLFKGLGGSDKN